MPNFPNSLWCCCLSALLVANSSGLAARPLPKPHIAAAGPVSVGAAQAGAVVACYVERESPAGMAFAVFHNGEILQSRGFGWADLEQRVPVTPATRFRLASVSKLFTAGAMARLSQEGRLDLDAPIRTYVPEFPAKPWPVSIRRIAAHLGGIRGYEDKDFAPENNINLRRFETTAEALTIFADDPLLWEPGTGYHYSTFGFTLLAAAIERVSGKPYAAYLQNDFLAPLRIASIVPDDPDQVVPDRGRFYDVAPDGRLVNADYVRSDYKFGGGGLIGTAEDLARYGSAHMHPGFFSEAVLRNALFEPQLRTDGRSTQVGLAWRIGIDPQLGRVYHHSGSLPGARSVLMVWPDQSLSLAAMSNTSDAPHNAEDFADALSHVILDVRRGAADAEMQNMISLDLTFEEADAEEVRRLELDPSKPCNGTLQTPGYLKAELRARGYSASETLNLMGSYRLADGRLAVLAASRLGLHRLELDIRAQEGEMLDLENKFTWSFERHPLKIH